MKSGKIQFVLVDNHVVFRKGVLQILSSYADIVSIDEKDDLEELFLMHVVPDIVLLGISMKNRVNRMKLKRVLKRYPELRIILVVNNVDEDLLVVLQEFPVLGGLLRSSSEAEVREAFFMVLNHAKYFTKEFSKQIHSIEVKAEKIYQETQLSVEQYLVVKLLCKGYNQEEIADKLQIAPRTVESTLIGVKKTLGERSAQGVINYVLKNNIVSLKMLLYEDGIDA